MSTNMTKILMVEDDLANARVYTEYLRNEHYEVIHVATGQEALDQLKSNCPDLVILDLQLPDMSGLDILKTIQQEAIATSVVVVTANGSIDTAVEAMRWGATDFVLKPFNGQRLIFTLRHALERKQLTKIVETFRHDYDRADYCNFVGSSLAMQEIYQTIGRAASSKATIFITGDSGTGKEVCAEAIHVKSPRKDKPFVVLNCGAIPKDLIESEIFGHVKGSFTGAIADRDGAATTADGGTLFLDEICEMDLALQVKLLRFIQTGSFQKVGDSKMQEVDVRFVCATNRNPWEEVQTGSFREDLFYRLHVISIHLPPLADRDKDVMEIAERFLHEFTKEEGKLFTGFDADVITAFTAHQWPGNVRQLQNIIRNVVVLHEGPIITFDMLPAPFNDTSAKQYCAVNQPEHKFIPTNGSSDLVNMSSDTFEVDLKPLWQVEHDLIRQALKACDGNVQRAAGILELSPSTLYRRLRDLKAQAAAHAAE